MEETNPACCTTTSFIAAAFFAEALMTFLSSSTVKRVGEELIWLSLGIVLHMLNSLYYYVLLHASLERSDIRREETLLPAPKDSSQLLPTQTKM